MKLGSELHRDLALLELGKKQVVDIVVSGVARELYPPRLAELVLESMELTEVKIREQLANL